jgi:hypothetical protein
VWLAVGIDAVQRFIKDLQFILFHLHQTPDEHLPALVGQTRNGLVEVVPEGGVGVGGKTGLVYRLLLIYY